MVAIAVQDDHLSARQSIGSMLTSPSRPFTMPASRSKIWLNTMPTAATEVTIGSSTPIRRNVRPRSFWLSRLARTSANSSCGTVASTSMPTVLSDRVPEVGVREQGRVVVEADELARAADVPVVQRHPGRVAEREQPEDREDHEERRDEQVRRPGRVDSGEPVPRPPPRWRDRLRGALCPGTGRQVHRHHFTRRLASSTALLQASSGWSLPCSTASSALPTRSPICRLSGPR